MGEDKGMLKALALATQLGFAVAGPMVVFIGGGVWLDSVLGTGHWLFFLGLVLGIGSAGAALFQIAASQPARKPGTSIKKEPDTTGGTVEDRRRTMDVDDDETTDD